MSKVTDNSYASSRRAFLSIRAKAWIEHTYGPWEQRPQRQNLYTGPGSYSQQIKRATSALPILRWISPWVSLIMSHALRAGTGHFHPFRGNISRASTSKRPSSRTAGERSFAEGGAIRLHTFHHHDGMPGPAGSIAEPRSQRATLDSMGYPRAQQGTWHPFGPSTIPFGWLGRWSLPKWDYFLKETDILRRSAYRKIFSSRRFTTVGVAGAYRLDKWQKQLSTLVKA
jgi:hypothetical protein